MSAIVLSALELRSTVNNNGKSDALSETSIEIENINEKCAQIGGEKIEEINENKNNLNCALHRERSPINSIGSNNISIITLDENEENSSVIDSDTDDEEVINNIDSQYKSPNENVLVNKHIDAPNLNQSSILCSNNDAKPNIGSIAVQNSSDITFGNKTFYHGPVTINHFVYDKNKWTDTKTQENDNLGYVHSTTDSNLDRNEKDIAVTKEHPDENYPQKWIYSHKHALLSALVTGILICSLLTLIIVVKYNTGMNHNAATEVKIGDGDDSRLNIPIASTIESDIITDTAGPLRIVSRGDWIAQPPNSDLVKLELPANRVIIAHTATENCTAQSSCVYRVRMIQTFHMESRRWDDIGYNFLVGGDGAVYVGRGWDIQGAHTKGYNVKSICIAFIGTFNKIVPPERQLYAARKLMEEGVKLGKLTPDYKLFGHRQLISSESPGSALYDIIKKWDHWTEKIN